MRLRDAPALWSKMSLESQIQYIDRQVRTDMELQTDQRTIWRQLMEDYDARLAAGKRIESVAYRMREFLARTGSPLAKLIENPAGSCLPGTGFDRMTQGTISKEA
ncbi:MAG: hypothetical protein ACM3NH_00175 [Candidatus Saccharibacteria bacterium]